VRYDYEGWECIFLFGKVGCMISLVITWVIGMIIDYCDKLFASGLAGSSQCYGCGAYGEW
jgi:hypothetical protein